MTDHRRGPRRRGEALHAAIYAATLAELTEVGYAGLTMERVADRAAASKASLYRRWPSRMELALDAVRSLVPDPDAPPDTGTLRGDLLALMGIVAGLLAGPAGEALRGALGDALPDAARTAELRRRSPGNSVRAMREIARRAAARGEIDPAPISELRLEVGPALLRHQFLFAGETLDDAVLVEVVDEVVVPLLRGRG